VRCSFQRAGAGGRHRERSVVPVAVLPAPASAGAATCTVTSTAENGAGKLREKLGDANCDRKRGSLFMLLKTLRRHLAMWVLLAAFGSPVAMADPMPYTINFSGPSGTLLPTAGTFTYDADTSVFSSFLVIWDGISFDLTASANAPSTSGVSFPSCVGSLTGGAASFALLRGDCAGEDAVWRGSNITGDVGFTFTTNFDPFMEISESKFDDVGSAIGTGTWTISQQIPTVPEPSTFTLSALMLCAIAVGKRIAPGLRQATGRQR